MQLRDFINENQKKVTDFAAELRVTRDCVQKYMSGDRIPGKKMMKRILGATNGAVTANDFYGLPEMPSHNKPKKRS